MQTHEFILTILGVFGALEAILFGVFGFLYSIFAMFLSTVAPDEQNEELLDRPPICDTLRKLCRILSVFIFFNALFIGLALWFLGPSGTQSIILAAALGTSMLAIAVTSLVLSWWIMG